MARPLPLVGLLLAGCVAGRATTALSPSPVRTAVADSARAMTEARLAGDGWAGEVLEVSRSGQAADNPGEQWDETAVRVRFEARGPDGVPRPLTQPELAAFLAGLRGQVRRTIAAFGGEALDASEGEGFRERWLAVPYRVGQTAGTVRATVGPASGRDDETAGRLELVVRETPAR